MNKKITKMLCGFAVTSLAAFAVVACDNETLSGPDFNSTNSSLAESSSSLVESSSSLAESSSALVESSSSEVQPSSSSAEVCANITTTKCMTGCDALVTPEMKDCETGVMFVCKKMDG